MSSGSRAGDGSSSPLDLEVLLSLDVDLWRLLDSCLRRGVLDLALALDLDLDRSLGQRAPVPEFLSAMQVMAAQRFHAR